MSRFVPSIAQDPSSPRLRRDKVPYPNRTATSERCATIGAARLPTAQAQKQGARVTAMRRRQADFSQQMGQ